MQGMFRDKMSRLVVGCAALLAPAMGIGACGGEPNGEATGQGGSETAEGGAVDTVLASLDVGYGTVSFHEVTLDDGSVLISGTENIPASYRNTPYQRLLAEGHTSLEMWKSLLPNQAPPASLQRAHAAEATVLKRPTSEVIPGLFDRTAQIEQSASSCRSLANSTVWKPVASDACYDYAWVNKRSSLAQTGDRWFGVIDNAGATTDSNVTMGVCNDSDVDISGRVLVKKADSGSYVPIFSAWATITPGHMHYWYNFSRMSLSSCDDVPPGQLCLTLPLPSAYRVEGNSAAGAPYYLYTGVLSATLKDACVPR